MVTLTLTWSSLTDMVLGTADVITNEDYYDILLSPTSHLVVLEKV
jgi:hypothetical protein